MMPGRTLKTIILLSIGAGSLFLLRCSENPAFAGGVETTNGLTVVSSAVAVHGRAPTGSMVFLFSKSYNPLADQGESGGFCDSGFVDSSQIYSFAPYLDSGYYNIIARNANNDSGAVISGFLVQTGCYDSLFIPFDTFGEINGTVIRIAHGDTVPESSLGIFCQGTNLIARSDSLGHYVISNVPMGQYIVKWWVDGPQIASLKNNDNLAVLSGETKTAVVDFVVE